MTAEELLMSDEVEVFQYSNVIEIDGQSRHVNVPIGEDMFGVEGDKNVTLKHFTCPKIVGNNIEIDLSEHNLYANYTLADEKGNPKSEDVIQSPCENIVIGDDNITFDWKISEWVTKEDGYIAFSIVAKKSVDGVLETRWYTTPAVGKVLKTVKEGRYIEQQYPDVIDNLMNRVSDLERILANGGGTGGSITVDDALSETSTNPVQNKVVTKEIRQLSEEIVVVGKGYLRLTDNYSIGGLDGSGSLDTNSAKLTTTNFKKFDTDTVIYVMDGFSCIVCTYSDDETMLTRVVYNTDKILIEANVLFKICIFKDGISPSSQYEWDDILLLESDISKQIKSITVAKCVEEFGAKGDGITDDTVAIQKALDSGYNIVFGKNKTYIVSDRLFVTIDGTRIIGNNAIIKVSPSVAEKYVSNYDPALLKIYKRKNVHIENLIIDGSKTFIARTDDTTEEYTENTTKYLASRSVGYSGINFEKCENCIILGCTVHNTIVGIGAKNSSFITISKCYVHHTIADAYPLYHGVRHMLVDNCIASNNGDDALAVYGLKKYWDAENVEIDVVYPYDITFSNCFVENCRARAFINNGGVNVRFRNCIFDKVMCAFRVAYESGVDNYKPDKTYVTDCTFNVTPFDGITIAYSAKINDGGAVYFRNNTIVSNKRVSNYGNIHVTGNTNLKVSNSKFQNVQFGYESVEDTVLELVFDNVYQRGATFNTFNNVETLLLNNCDFSHDVISTKPLINIVNCKNVTLLNNKQNQFGNITCRYAETIETDNIKCFNNDTIADTSKVKLKNVQFVSKLYKGVYENGAILIVDGVIYKYNNGWEIVSN